MTIEEILMGRRRGGADDGFPGLIPLVRSYLELIGADTATNRLVDRYVSVCTTIITTLLSPLNDMSLKIQQHFLL